MSVEPFVCLLRLLKGNYVPNTIIPLTDTSELKLAGFTGLSNNPILSCAKSGANIVICFIPIRTS